MRAAFSIHSLRRKELSLLSLCCCPVSWRSLGSTESSRRYAGGRDRKLQHPQVHPDLEEHIGGKQSSKVFPRNHLQKLRHKHGAQEERSICTEPVPRQVVSLHWLSVVTSFLGRRNRSSSLEPSVSPLCLVDMKLYSESGILNSTLGPANCNQPSYLERIPRFSSPLATIGFGYLHRVHLPSLFYFLGFYFETTLNFQKNCKHGTRKFFSWAVWEWVAHVIPHPCKNVPV